MSRHQLELYPIPVTDVWNHIGVDLVGLLPEPNRGNKYIVTASQQQTTLQSGHFQIKPHLELRTFSSLFCRHGWPKILSCDQRREFVNAVSHCLFDITKVEQCTSSAYHPQTNGLDERTNHTLVRSLMKLSSSQADWDLNIDAGCMLKGSLDRKEQHTTAAKLQAL